MPSGAPPTLEEFKHACGEAFSFVTEHGFQQVVPQRSTNPFEVWFRRRGEFIILQGEGWGTHATGFLEHVSGFELAIIYLVPLEARPPKWKRGKRQPSQLDQIRQEASWLQSYGDDFLRGDLARFLRLAKPLPHWKEKISNAR